MISNPLKANKSNISSALPANACLKGKINYLTLIHRILTALYRNRFHYVSKMYTMYIVHISI